MVTVWMGYGLGVTALVALAALALERLLRRMDGPTRAAPALAMLFSLVAFAGAWIWAALPAADAGTGSVSATVGVPVVLQAVEAAPVAAVPLSTLLGWGWLLASAVLLSWLLAGWWRLHGVMKGAVRTDRGDTTIWVTSDFGPAVTGLPGRRILVPGWLLEEDPGSVDTVLEHEREHLRARDPELVMVCMTALVVMPWNLPLWWLLERLRLAIESDCDRRVLARRGLQPSAYGRLLLDIGERGRGRSLAVAAFGERASNLERRLERIMERPGKKKTWAVAAIGFVAGSLLTAAWLIPRPDVAPAIPRLAEQAEAPPEPVATLEELPAPVAEDGEFTATEVEFGEPEDVSDVIERGPAFTPMTVRPEITNVLDVIRAMEAEYPPLLRDAGIGGRVVMWLYVDSDGVVQDTRISQSSGHAALDDAALRVGEVYEFTPAMNNDERVGVWVQFPITFQVDASREETAPASPTRQPLLREVETVGEDAYDRAPVLQNAGAMQRAVIEEYPPILREAGIGGRVVTWAYIDESGTLTDRRVHETSGHAALDRAALEVLGQLQDAFTAAVRDGEAVGAWIQLPITFGGQ